MTTITVTTMDNKHDPLPSTYYCHCYYNNNYYYYYYYYYLHHRHLYF